jgi:TonB family protein
MQSTPENFPDTPGREQATVEETSADLELLTILRNAAETGSHSLDSIVDAVGDAARALSGADGTALGLETKGAIVCRARSGNIAPPLGAPISSESGISGECLRTATMLVCHDAMSDARVDAEVCRSLGIRSIVAIPVRGPKGAAGILEAFSARANAFDGEALTSLRDLATIAEIAYQREASSHVVAKPVAAAVTRPMPRSTPLAAEDILDDLSQPNKGRVRWAVFFAAALLVVVGVAWWAWHTPADEASSSAQNVRAANPVPAASQPAHEIVPKPGPGVPTSRSDHPRTNIVQNAAEVKPIDLRPDEMAAASGRPDTIEVRAPKGPAGESAPAPEPPTVDLTPASNPEALTQLTSVQPQMPTAAPRVSQGVVEAALIHRVEPSYPSQARTQRVQGRVTLTATIAVDGSVRDVTVVSGAPVLAEAARNAVRQWKYHPATLNGSAVAVQKEIIVIFAQP